MTFSRVLAAGALLLAAAPALAAPPRQIGKLEGRLDIVAWPGYLERGETDKKYDWLTRFEKDTGCKVNVKTAGTSDEMVALMSQGGYDLVTASGDASLRLVFGKTVQEVNVGLVPSWKNVDARLKNASWHTVDGKHYGVPYQWGANFLMYRTDVFKEAPRSWDVTLVEMTLPDGKPNKGRVQAYDGPIFIADGAMYLKKARPELGIQDPYELDEKQYAEVLKLLRGQHKLVHRYWHDVTVQMSDFKKEGVLASGAWGYQANALKGEGQPIAVTVPQEGSTGWADTTMLHAKAKHPNCAYRWMEWSLDPGLQSALAEWFGSNPVTPEACKAKAPGGGDFCGTNGFDRFESIYFWKTPVAKCKTRGTCVPYSRWTTDYIAIMGGR